MEKIRRTLLGKAIRGGRVIDERLTADNARSLIRLRKNEWATAVMYEKARALKEASAKTPSAAVCGSVFQTGDECAGRSGEGSNPSSSK